MREEPSGPDWGRHTESKRRCDHGPTRIGQGGTLVVLGSSAKYPFDRMLRAVCASIDSLPKPVFVQDCGAGIALPAGVERADFLSHDEFAGRLASARLVICHAGAGTILDALGAGLPVIAMARFARLGECPDEHQSEFADALQAAGLIRRVESASELVEAVDSMLHAARGTVEAPMSRRLSWMIAGAISRAIAAGARPKIAVVASSGGHLTEIRLLHAAYAPYEHFFVVNKSVGCSPEMLGRTYLFASSDRDWRVLKHIARVWRMLKDERPGIILSTGSGSAVPVLVLGRVLCGAKVFFIESLTRVHAPSFTARLVYPIADLFIFRWPGLRRFFPRAAYVAALPRLQMAAAQTDVRDRSIVRVPIDRQLPTID